MWPLPEIAKKEKKLASVPSLMKNTRTFFFILFHTLLLSSFWTSRGHRCPHFSPPGFCLQVFIEHRVQQSIPPLVDYPSSVANPRSRAFRKSTCPQEKVPTNRYEHALDGARTHEIDLYYARGQPDNLIRHRGDVRPPNNPRI